MLQQARAPPWLTVASAHNSAPQPTIPACRIPEMGETSLTPMRLVAALNSVCRDPKDAISISRNLLDQMGEGWCCHNHPQIDHEGAACAGNPPS